MFERPSNLKEKEKPSFRLAAKIFGVNLEVKTSNAECPITLDANCSDKKLGLDVNGKFASLVFSELVGSLGSVMLDRHGRPEMASKVRDEMQKRRNAHEFGGTLDRMDEILEPLNKCLRERLMEKERNKNQK